MTAIDRGGGIDGGGMLSGRPEARDAVRDMGAGTGEDIRRAGGGAPAAGPGGALRKSELEPSS